MTVAWDPLHAELRRALSRPGVPPHVVDDLVQDATERLLRRLPGLRDADRLGPYVGRVVRSVWVDHLRRRPAEDPLPEGLVDPGEADDLELTARVASWLPGFVARLPEPYREAVRLSELEGLSQVEVARRLGLSASGARTRIQRGRRQIRAELEACCRIERHGGRVVSVTPRASDGPCDGC